MIELSDINYLNQLEKFANEFHQLEQHHIKATEAAEKIKDAKDKRRETSGIKKIEKLQQQLDAYCRQFTILTFNGSRYDLALVKRYLFPAMVKSVRAAKQQHDKSTGQYWPRSITRGSSIICLSTKELKFLDIVMYLSPGVNLAKFIKIFNPNGESKSVFPYELIRQPDDLLTITQFPSKSAFYSTLKNSTISDEEYEEAKRIWYSLPEQNMLEYVKHYNIRDCEPFLVACTNMAETYFKEFSIDIYREAISIPGICLPYLFRRLQELQPTVRFALFDEPMGSLYQELYKSICGGLAIIIQRIAEANVTPVRSGQPKLIKKVLGYDCNALYLYCIGQDMPTGHPIHWKLEEKENGEHQFKRKSRSLEEQLRKRKSHGECHYLKFRAWLDGVFIQTAEDGHQQCLGVHQWRVDGWAQNAQPRPRVYEYMGCYYHKYKHNCMNKKFQDAPEDLTQKAMDETKKQELEAMGIDVDVMWACEWSAIMKTAAELRQRYVQQRRHRQPPPPAPLTHPHLEEMGKKYNEFLAAQPKPRKFKGCDEVPYRKMFDSIMDGTTFGFVKCDVRTKPERREAYSDFPPVIKHASIGANDVGEFMKKRAQETLKDQKRDALIGSYFGDQIWVMTPLVQFYHTHDVEITKIYEVVSFDRERPFHWFAKNVTDLRKQGDVDPSMAVLGEIIKLLGNSAYGKCATNVEKHQNVYFADAQEAAEAHNNPFHHRTVEIKPDECYEIHKRKEVISFKLPSMIGLAVYAYAKLHLLRFVYDVLFEFFDKSDYICLESDTDSVYIGIAGESLEELVIPEKRAKFEQIKHEWFVIDPSDKRTPGLFKIEKEGQAFCGLCAKTYIVVDQKTGKKVSSKGMQQVRNEEILVFENYKNILFDDPAAITQAYNMGIRPIDGQVCTYIQEKAGLTSLYLKRKCNPDGSTEPLDL